MFALKEDEAFQDAVGALSEAEKDIFLFKFIHVFVEHKGKENQEEVIWQFLSEYYNDNSELVQELGLN